jgi:hypothetical protein
MYPNPYYTDEIYNLAIPHLSDESLAEQAARVAEVPTFQWLYVPRPSLSDPRAQKIDDSEATSAASSA